ncbi:MAG: glycosyltransferase family 39 protein [Pyrinomonadaceae bacterium]
MLMLLLSLIALALRVWGLNSDLWVDEVFTLLDFVRVPLGEIVTSYPSQNQHMLLSLLSHISISVFGESAWALRIPSVMFGVASLWALFLLGRSMAGKREALLASALMTVSYHHVWFRKTHAVIWASFSLLCWRLGFGSEASRKDSWGWWLGYVAAVSLGMWIHMTMAFVVAAHVLIYLGALIFPFRNSAGVNQRSVKASALEEHVKAPGIYRLLVSRAKLKPVIAWLLCVSVTLQLYALALPEFIQTGFHEVSLESEWTSPLWVIAEAVRNLRLGEGGLIGLAVMMGAGIVLTGAGWVSLLRRDCQSALAVVLPALLAGAAMLALGHNLWPRFFFFSMGFGLLIIVHGVVVCAHSLFAHFSARPASEESWGQIAGLALVCLLIAASAATLRKNYMLPKQNFSGARDYVEHHRRPDEGVVAVGLAGIMYGRYFAPQWSVAQTQSELDAVWRRHSSTWPRLYAANRSKSVPPRNMEHDQRGF